MQQQNMHSYGQGDFYDVAAAYAFPLAESQAFLDGNKRTGRASAITFPKFNCKSLTGHSEELYNSMIAIARSAWKPNLATLLREHSGQR